MAHEQSITIEDGQGGWVNIPGVVGGKFQPEAAERLFREGKLKPLPGRWRTVEEATAAAGARSESNDEAALERGFKRAKGAP